MNNGLNQKTVTVKMTRNEVCSLIVALQTLCECTDVAGFYRELREKIKEQLVAFDKKQLNREV